MMLSDFAKGLVEDGGYGAMFFLTMALCVGHALGDYPLQGAFLSSTKNRRGDSSVFFSGGEVPRGLWIHALTAHSMIQGGIVWLITGSGLLFLLELVFHWITDFVKCDELIGYTTDQVIHVGCKVLYVVLIFWWGGVPF